MLKHKCPICKRDFYCITVKATLATVAPDYYCCAHGEENCLTSCTCSECINNADIPCKSIYYEQKARKANFIGGKQVFQ